MPCRNSFMVQDGIIKIFIVLSPIWISVVSCTLQAANIKFMVAPQVKPIDRFPPNFQDTFTNKRFNTN